MTIFWLITFGKHCYLLFIYIHKPELSSIYKSTDYTSSSQTPGMDSFQEQFPLEFWVFKAELFFYRLLEINGSKATNLGSHLTSEDTTDLWWFLGPMSTWSNKGQPNPVCILS